MENETWIKLYRKLLLSPIFANEKALKVWIWCLLKATYKERDQVVGRQIVHLKKGEFITGRLSASKELKMKERTVYDYLKLLQSSSMLRINSNNKFSVVSIEKWEDYQIEENEKQQQSNNRPTTDQHKQEYKEIYINLFNNIKAKIEGQKFSNKIMAISKMRETKEYLSLTQEEQDRLFNELISLK